MDSSVNYSNGPNPSSSQQPATHTNSILPPLTDNGNVHLVKIIKQPNAANEALEAAKLIEKVAGWQSRRRDRQRRHYWP